MHLATQNDLLRTFRLEARLAFVDWQHLFLNCSSLNSLLDLFQDPCGSKGSKAILSLWQQTYFYSIMASKNFWLYRSALSVSTLFALVFHSQCSFYSLASKKRVVICQRELTSLLWSMLYMFLLDTIIYQLSVFPPHPWYHLKCQTTLFRVRIAKIGYKQTLWKFQLHSEHMLRVQLDFYCFERLRNVFPDVKNRKK